MGFFSEPRNHETTITHQFSSWPPVLPFGCGYRMAPDKGTQQIADLVFVDGNPATLGCMKSCNCRKKDRCRISINLFHQQNDLVSSLFVLSTWCILRRFIVLGPQFYQKFPPWVFWLTATTTRSTCARLKRRRSMLVMLGSWGAQWILCTS